MKKKKKPDYLISGIIERRPDGSCLVSRVRNGKEIRYILPPRKSKPEGRQAECCSAFADISRRAYAEVRDPVKAAVWNAQWHDYKLMMEELGMEIKYNTLRGFVMAEMMKGEPDKKFSL